MAEPLRCRPDHCAGRRGSDRDRLGRRPTPWILVDQVLIADAAGAKATLVGLLVVVGLAAVTVVPALAYLFWLTQTDTWSRDEAAPH
ncbi:hypothetical protein HYG77_25890 [Rhodococcus sp. ZPP]|uniref:hypothetical protein n=1 Tax=Rhodococcus sp. ZPP TaxID=2749906 RepID=UPI001AD8695C|nr:hypothetical protein [Rhodococcus sp. ZPP]QTJ68640.1 hypothetical protein HYG77_25890 [Rhodococcus sp. ZPP]